MNLRTRAVLLSAFPLAVILLHALPEFVLQMRVIAASELDQRAHQLVRDAYDIEDYRLLAAGDLRRRSIHFTNSDDGYARSVGSMRAAMSHLEAEAGPDQAEIGTTRRIIAEATNILAMFRRVQADLLIDHPSSALAILGSVAYLDQVQKLQADVQIFRSTTDATAAGEFRAVQSLWRSSMLLLILSVIGLVLASLLLFVSTAQVVRGILELGRKGERYRRGDPVGPRSTRRDEIGRLDVALHEYFETIGLRDQELLRYRLLADVTRDIILFVDRVDLIVVDANAAALAAYGYERADFIGKHLAALRAPDHALDPTVLSLSDRPEGLSIETMCVRSDGTVFPVEINARTATIDGRRMIVGTIRDISERRRAAEQMALALEMKQSAEQLRLVVEAAPNAMILADAGGHISLVNAAAEHLFGFSRRELLGRAIECLVPERFRDGHPLSRAGYAAAPAMRPMGDGQTFFGLRKDGREVPVEIGLNPISTPEGAFVLASFNDVTERKQAEELRLANAGMAQHAAELEALNAEIERRERQLQRYRLLADVTSDSILFIDRHDLTIIDANAAAIAAYGYERDAFIGKPVTILRRPDEPFDPRLLDDSDTPAGSAYEAMHQRCDGTCFPVEGHAHTADVNGRPTIIATIRDISERRRDAEQVSRALEQAVEALRVKGEFVATMSHEIRTPMHGVIGMSELLLERPLGPVEREYAATLKQSAHALLAVIDDVLDFSKLEANKIELESVPFNPAQVVDGVMNLIRGTARNKGLSLRSYASPHVPATLRGDPTRLRQILINLVGNAVKFTAAGGVTVSMSVDRDDRRSVVLSFAVIDTGIGVSPEASERLFEAFAQGDSSTTRKFGGTGLGLSISRRLAELMGGRIWLGEHDGPGSTFCFTARFERTTEEVAASIPAAGALRVLVLDNDVSTRRALEATLASWNLHCAAVGDTEAARTQLRDAARSGSPFDVVLIDYVLPRSDGLAFATELGADPELGEPARILLTAFDAVGRRKAALAAGCVAYLPKPVDPSALYDALHAIDEGRKTATAGTRDEPRHARVLLAEDSPLIRQVARFQLDDLQYPADIVENGEQAVAAVTAGDYELVLMDMRMPDMDGLEATRAIRAAERESGRHIVVVALTANALEGDRNACIEAGMDDFVTKPLKLESLRAVLERWLPQRG